MRAQDALGHIADVGLTGRDCHALRGQVFDVLDGAIGFDKASMHSIGGAGQEIGVRGFADTTPFAELPGYMNELDPRELAALSGERPRVDVDVLSARRRDALSVYRRVLLPEMIRVFVTVMWRDDDGAAGVSLGRTGRGARFSASELRMLELLLPAIRLADALVTLRARQSRSFEAWSDAAGLGAQERAVTALAIRGLANHEIASVLGVSPNTVRNQLAAVFRKVDVTTRAELGFIAGGFAADTARPVERPPWLAHLR